VKGVEAEVPGRGEARAEESYVAEPVDFDAFFRGEYHAVLALAMALLGSAAAAEDATQDAFLAVYRRWRTGEGLTNPSGYVRTALVNRCRSTFRRRLSEARAMASPRRWTARTVELPEETDEFWNAVRSLPVRQAQVVALHYLEDRPVVEVASILGVAEGTVKAHLLRARRTLADRFGDEAADEGEEGR
jgi:RNA polymerase sigma-70 factor (ECF subfamily)